MAEETEVSSSSTEKNRAAEAPATTIDQLSNPKVGGRKEWGNKLVVNTGRNPVVNFNFMLRVEGVFDLPCKTVKGIRRENEFDYIQEGGLNDYVHLKRKAITKPFTFQVERYVGVDWVDPLPLGTELVLPLILFVNTHVFPGLQPVRSYVFTGCTVTGKDYGELNAEASGLLMETVTIAYREMVCLDIPSDTYKSGDVWNFNGKEKEGTGERHYNANLYNKDWEKKYSSQDKMEKRAEKNRYKHSKIAKKNVAAETSKDELTQTQMEGKAARWEPKKNTDGSLKVKYGKDYETYVTDYNKKIEEEIKKAGTAAEKLAAEAKKIALPGTENRKYVHSKTASREGSATYPAKELTKEEMEEKAVLYQHSKTASRDGAAAYPAKELTKAQMEEKAALWKPEQDTDGSLKNKYGKDYETYVTNYNSEIEKEIDSAETAGERAEAEAKRIAMSDAKRRKYVHSRVASRDGSAAYPENELTKEEMEEKAVLYQHSNKASREGSATYPKKELSRTELEEKAALWKPEQDGNGGLKTKYAKDYETIAKQQAKTSARKWPPVRSARQITEYLKKN